MLELYNGDCLEIMKDLPSESVDLVVTSPPYNLGNAHHTGNKRFNPYNDDMPEEDYQKWQIEVLNECYRILKDDGSMMYNHKNRLKNGVQITPYEWLLKTKFLVKQEVVWFNRSQNFDKIRFYPMTERVYWLAKSAETKLCNVINHHDVFEWSAEGTSGVHKRAFPSKMVEDLIDCFPNANVIFDPFMGSGTTGKVAKEKDKSFLGIELNKVYFRAAKNRIDNTAVIYQLFG